MHYYLSSLLVLLVFTINAQSFQRISNLTENDLGNFSELSSYKAFKIDLESIQHEIHQNASVILPTTDGFSTFVVESSGTMSPDLQEQFPSILSLRGYDKHNTKTQLRLDINEKGVFAHISNSMEDYFLSSTHQPNTLLLFSKADYQSDFHRSFSELPPRSNSENISQARKDKAEAKPNGGTLRTYRTAIACTGEYAQFHGGTTNNAVSAIVTTVNRLNEVYERDLSIHLELIANLSSIVYTNSTTDPFTNDDANLLIDESQSVINTQIGSSNYDVGHTFSTGGGGLAELGSVCGFFKASGITGSAFPIGDAYDIDFVAHEFGHQFGATHTFNGNKGSCDGSLSINTAYEPGSGSTIMAYAGICSPQNIAQNSDDHFHTTSYEQIVNYITSGNGSTCGTSTSLSNTAPIVDAGVGGFTIPISTPFQLTGSATDAEDNTLTYNWEQYDLGASGSPLSPIGNAPLFRSFPSSSDRTRYFPQLSNLLSGTSSIGEYLPDYTRDINFRLTVRDNHPGGGGVDFDELTISVSDQAGPFLITSQNTAISYQIGESVTVNWDVANTNTSPINASSVDIWLSIDGGNTFDQLLIGSTANDGSEIVTLPNTPSTTARIKVIPTNNIFFAINTSDFSITTPTTPDFSLTINPSSQEVCFPDSFAFNILVDQFLGFTETVNLSVQDLPFGMTANFNSTAVNPGNSTTMYINTKNLPKGGSYSWTLSGMSTSKSHSQSFSVRAHNSDSFSEGILVMPTVSKTDVSLTPELKWSNFEDVDHYAIDIATDTNFSSIVYQISSIADSSHIVPTLLNPNTKYYWRVKGFNNCGTTPYSATSNFTTVGTTCVLITSTDTPIALSNGTSAFNSIINVPNSGLITDVNLKNISGTHEWVSDIDFNIYSPSGTKVPLLSDVCAGGAGNDFFMGFDDESINGSAPCPPIDGQSYVPSSNLSAFDNEVATGNWTLEIIDQFDFVDQGILNSWQLEVCFEDIVSIIDEIDHSFVQVIPNPASYSIEIVSEFEVEEINIYDGLGQKIITSTVNDISIRELPSGIYIVEIKGLGKLSRTRFLKQ